ncbi:MAG: ABC transporter permease [Dehalococcoidia bacterium]|nr:ABC transporter permease [Dehalococcoidia bacterium]
MRTIKAIFIKQACDTLKNWMVLIQFILFPIMALIMTVLIAKPADDIPNSMFVTMFAAMYAGMTPLVTVASVIAEDKEHKSLRFLVIAGVKPQEYLLGISGFVLTVGLIVAVLFGLIGGFGGVEFVKFVLVLTLGSVASAILGATIGVISKNQQVATATVTPVFMILAFSPMFAEFNETISKMTSFLYTRQVSMLVNDFDMSLTEPVLIVLANIAVVFVLFVVAYRKKGLRI